MSVSWTGRAKSEYEIAELNAASESRLSQRVPMRCWAKLFYESEDGSSNTIKVRVVNMSASGVLVEALRPFPVAAQVSIQANELLAGTAYVRRAAWNFWRFRIGLEFARAISSRY
jgi:hypothetical protein